MYQALYRKYRPIDFNDVIGQSVIVQTLKNSIETSKISHAYLFAGPRGTGKTTVAKIFARIINEVPSNIENLEENLDIIEIDAASNNGVDEIRELKSKVNLVPSNGKYKVYIIDEVHMLTVGAFNALLKTLEEPPAHIIFVLATTEPHKIPITILSRCQRFDFKKISVNNIVERLQKIVELEKIKISKDALIEIARLSDGGMRDAISTLDQVISYKNDEIELQDVHDINGSISRSEIQELLVKILDRNLEETIKLITAMNDDGKNLTRVVEDMAHYLRDVLIAITNQKDDEYVEIVKRANSFEIIYLIKEFMEALNEMKSYGDPKFILEIAIIKYINNNPIENQVKLNESKESIESVLKTQKKDEGNLEIEGSDNNLVNESEKIELDINEVIKIRINNAFTSISRKILSELKEKFAEVRSYLLNEKYKDIVPLILDGEMKAASKDYIIFVYGDSRLSTKFNHNIPIIEELLSEIYDKKYLVISVDLNAWNTYRKEYSEARKAKRSYEFIPENFDLKKMKAPEQQRNSNTVESLFGEMIEYK